MRHHLIKQQDRQAGTSHHTAFAMLLETLPVNIAWHQSTTMDHTCQGKVAAIDRANAQKRKRPDQA